MARKILTITALALAAGAVFTAWQAGNRTAAAEEAYPPIGAFVDVTDGRVHYTQTGSGPDVVLLHGAGGNLREFSFGLMDELATRYRVTAFDRPGMGYTGRVDGVDGSFGTEAETVAAQAAMLREASAALGIERPIVVGHSFGGAVAMAWAVGGLDQPDDPTNASAIVSLAGVLMPWPGDLGWYYWVNGSRLGGVTAVPLIAAFVSAQTVEQAVVETFAPQPAPQAYIDDVGAFLTLRPKSFRANTRQVNTLRPQIVELSARYPDLTLPIEIVHGTADTIVPIKVHPEELIKIVPSANLTRLEGVGHMPHHVDPKGTIAAIDRAAERAGLR